MAALSDGNGISWLANPFLVTSWFLPARYRKHAWWCSLTASLLALSFLRTDRVPQNEAGGYATIIQLRSGYWYWLAASLSAFAGYVFLAARKRARRL